MSNGYDDDPFLSPFTKSLLTVVNYAQQFHKVLSLVNEFEFSLALPDNTEMVEHGDVFVFEVEVQREEVVEKVSIPVFCFCIHYNF